MRTSLPPLLTATVGREQPIAAVDALLRQPDTRLVTVTGPGGVGKTRVALEVATRLDGQAIFPDGVVFVPLSDVRDPSFVIPTIASALDLDDPTGGSPAAALTAHLRDREMLVVLDNLEQVVDAVLDLAAIVRECQGVRLLVTSRVPLRLDGEREFLLQPLALPDARDVTDLAGLRRNASVALFTERAQRVRSTFELTPGNASAVAEACRLLDGLPLAIELAAARIKLLSPHDLVAHLSQRLALLTGGPRDLPARQQTLRDTIAWSYDLLDGDTQRLFRLVAAFSGGWTMELAAEVAGDGVDVLDGHATLIDHSLIRQVEQPDGSTRFGMLETIREFGREQLVTTGEISDTRQRVSQSIANLVSTGQPSGHWAKLDDAWLARLIREHDNLRAMLDWQIENEPVKALDLAGSLYWFWLTQGHMSEGRHWLDAALVAAPDAPERTLANALAATGDLASWQADFETADSAFVTSLALYERLDDQQGIARVWFGQARVAMFRNDYDLAAALYEQCLATYVALGDVGGLSSTRFNLGVLLRVTGDLDRAETLLLECVATARGVAGTATIMVGYANLCWIALARRQWLRALELGQETLAMFTTAREVRLAIESLGGIAIAAAMLGHRTRGARILGATKALRQRLIYPVPSMDQAEFAAFLTEAGIVKTDPGIDAAWAAGRALSIDEAVAEGLDLVATLTTVAPPAQPPSLLTPRELDVLRCLADGKTDREIAAELFISHHTVMRHVSNILGKLGVESRTAAATYAVRARLV